MGVPLYTVVTKKNYKTEHPAYKSTVNTDEGRVFANNPKSDIAATTLESRSNTNVIERI
jgi:hypothetical protein